jgi:carbonic anhydrase
MLPGNKLQGAMAMILPTGQHPCACHADRSRGIVDRLEGGAVTRRGFLQRAAAGAAAGIASAAILDLAIAPAAKAASTLTPDQALQQLADGNRRFVEGHLTHGAEDLDILKTKTVEKQEPFAAVLSCADSRVPIELIFDQSIGHVFVTRVAGNVASSEIIASLEYGAAVLGTKAIMVLGHRSCGAVKAAIDAKAVPGQISGLYRYIRPAVDQAGSDVDTVAKANAKIQAAILREASPVLADLIKKNELKIVAGFYDLASGKVESLG